MKRILIIGLAIFIFLTLLTLYSYAIYIPEKENLEEPTKEKIKPSEEFLPLLYAPGELIVKFKPRVGENIYQAMESAAGFQDITGTSSLNKLNTKYGVKKMERVFKELETKGNLRGLSVLSAKEVAQDVMAKFPQRTARGPKDAKIPDLENIYLLKLSKDANVLVAATEYAQDPDVVYAEPNYRVSSKELIPNDPSYPQQWAHEKMKSPRAWEIEKGSPNVVIANIDSGVDWNHPDLAANIWENIDEIPDAIDNDGNGYIDDVRGWDFLYNDNDPMDDNGHGTHTSGIAAAVTNNNEGIAGVCWESKIMALKFLDRYGYGGIDDEVVAIQYAVDNGADILSMSIGGYEKSRAEQDAIAYAHALGVVIVAAASNENTDQLSFPAAFEEVISVAASNKKDDRPGWSNYGTTIDVAAPGVNNFSTLWNNTYDSFSGTSMATPHVAGLAGLILSRTPTFTNEQVRQIIRKTAKDLGDSGWDLYFGYGRINAFKALEEDTIGVAYLATPEAESDVRGSTIEITGQAWAPDFKKYVLEYGSGVTPQSWETFHTSHTPVNNGVLGSWDVDILRVRDGIYTIKLEVISTDDKKVDDRVTINVDNVSIKKPKNGKMFFGSDARGTIKIKGSAAGPDFLRYRLEYGFGESPTEWTEIGSSTTPVIEGKLGKWDTSSLTEIGYYTIRLTMETEGYVDEERVTIYLDWNFHEGWPQKTQHSIFGSPVIGDVTGDGNPDIIVNDIYYVYVWNEDGSLVEPWPIRYESGLIFDGDFITSPVLGDLDKDGTLDIIVTSLDEVYAFKGNGTQVSSEWPVDLMNSNIVNSISPVVGDLDGDGTLDVVAGALRKLFVFHHDGRLFEGDWPKESPTGWGFTTPAIADVDGDSDLEIFVGDFKHQLLAWHHDGTPLDNWPQSTDQELIGPPVIGDVDGDGDLEILVSDQSYTNFGNGTAKVYAWHHNGVGVEYWPYDPTTSRPPYDDREVWWSFINGPSLADIDGDGDLEILIHGEQTLEGAVWDEVFILDHQANILSGWPQQTFEECWPSGNLTPPVVADIDGKPGYEIISSSYEKKIYAWHLNGEPVEGWTKLTKSCPPPSPAIGDIDNDGFLEIVYVDQKGMVYVRDLEAIALDSNLEWPMFQHDPQHTGLYTPPESAPQISITNLWTSDYSSNPKEEFSPGEEIRYNIDFSFTSQEDKKYKVIAKGKAYSNTEPSWKTPLKRQEKLFPGEYSWYWDETVPQDATQGSKAKVKLNLRLVDIETGEVIDKDKKRTYFKIK